MDLESLGAMKSEQVASSAQASVFNSQRKQTEAVVGNILEGVEQAGPDHLGKQLDMEI